MKKYLMWDDKDQQLYADPTIAGSITTKIGDVMGAGQKIIEKYMQLMMIIIVKYLPTMKWVEV